VDPASRLTITEQVVMNMSQGFERQGHVLYMDNYHSSPNMYMQLKNVGIGACGTVRSNSKQMPREMLATNLIVDKGDAPVFMKSTSDDLVTCVMMDTKSVQFLSTAK